MSYLLLMLSLFGCQAKHSEEGTEVGDCADGADNDADGYFDCDDKGCSGAPDCDEEESEDSEEDSEDELDEDTGDEDSDEEEVEYDPNLIGDPIMGETLYMNHCSGCHGEDGLGSISGPNLSDDIADEDDEELWEIILEGDDEMPAIVIEPQAVADIVAWLRLIFGSETDEFRSD